MTLSSRMESRASISGAGLCGQPRRAFRYLQRLRSANRHNARVGILHDAGLDGGGGEDRLDRLREALEPVDAADQDVAHAALLELRQHLHPELGALGLPKP